jgi:hypothetical protein
MVAVVPDKRIAAVVDGHAKRVIERSGRTDTFCEVGRPAPRECAHHAAGRNCADAVVAVVRHIQYAARINGNATWVAKRSTRAGAVNETIRPTPR